jgi:glyoxylate reductase
MGRVLVSTDLPGPWLDVLRASHEVTVGPDPTGLGRERILAVIHEYDALISLLSDRIDETMLDKAPALRIVANCAVGTDNIDLAACRRREIIVTNTPDVLTESTADLTFALILDACRRVTEGDRQVRARKWTGWSPTHSLGMRVTGATLGIVGLGRIGQAVARRAMGFSMRVLYTQRHRAGEQTERELGALHVDLHALLGQSDVVSLCCPLTPETRGLINAERIALMKRGAILVNTSRGPCVDEDALADALEKCHLAGAGLDVYAEEPHVPERLLACERVVLAPHIGSADRPTREAMARICVESVLAVLSGREPERRVV